MERLEAKSAVIYLFILNDHSLPKEEDAFVSVCTMSRTAVFGTLARYSYSIIRKIKTYFYWINTVSALGKDLFFQFLLR